MEKCTRSDPLLKELLSGPDREQSKLGAEHYNSGRTPRTAPSQATPLEEALKARLFVILLIGVLLTWDLMWLLPKGNIGVVSPLLLAGAFSALAVRGLFSRSVLWLEIAVSLVLLSSPAWLPDRVGVVGTVIVIVAGSLAMAARRWPARARWIVAQIYRHVVYLGLLWPLYAAAAFTRLALHDGLIWLTDCLARWLGFVAADRRSGVFPKPLAPPQLATPAEVAAPAQLSATQPANQEDPPADDAPADDAPADDAPADDAAETPGQSPAAPPPPAEQAATEQ